MSKRLFEIGDWKKVAEKCLVWPENNQPATTVYQKDGMGELLVYRFNMEGKEIYNNETRFMFRTQPVV